MFKLHIDLEWVPQPVQVLTLAASPGACSMAGQDATLALLGVTDTTAPTWGGATLGATSLTSYSYILSASANATDAAGVTGYRYRINGGSWVTGPTRSFAVTGRMAGATDACEMQARDAAGNWSASIAGSVVLAAEPPPPNLDGMEIDPGSFRVWHNDGPKIGTGARVYNSALALRWQNRNGEWLDAAQTPMGATPWARPVVETNHVGWVEFDLTALAQRWFSGLNRGAYLMVGNDVNASAWARIAGTLSANPPQIVVTDTVGGVHTITGDLGGFTVVSGTAAAAPTMRDSSLEFLLNRSSRALLHFHGLRSLPSVASATVRLYINSADDIYTMPITVMETDAPALLLGGAGLAPQMGLAAEVGSEDGLIGHPDVFAAGDFREANWNYQPGVWKDQTLSDFGNTTMLFESVSMSQAQYLKTYVVPDPDYPGRFYMDTCIATGQIGGGELKCLRGMTRGLDADPAHPVDPSTVITEAFVRVEVWLDADSFWSSLYSFKFSPVGWDLRMGLWDPTKGWNNLGGSRYVFGSGQTPSDGRKSWNSEYSQWLYQGHSIRGHTMGWPHPTNTAYPQAVGLGFAPSHLGPYDFFWDGGLYGTEQNLRMWVVDPGGKLRQHCIPKGRWVTMESQCRLNSIDLNSPDVYGNGTANNDGILRVWMDGVLVGERTNLAWRRHPEMGIRSNWLMQYHGGSSVADHDIRIRYRNFVMAKRYIGPAV